MFGAKKNKRALGGCLFLISNNSEDERPGAAEGFALDSAGIDTLAQFCTVDHWSANLSNALLSMGDHAKRFHGFDLERERFGLLEYVCCYEERRQAHIVSLFEHAASSGRPFHFSAALEASKGRSRVVQCFGALRTNPHGAEELFGAFLFSRDLYVNL